MTYQFQTPTGPLTVDHTATMAYLLSHGAYRVHHSQIAKRDPILPRDAHSPDRPVAACGRAAFFGHNS